MYANPFRQPAFGFDLASGRFAENLRGVPQFLEFFNYGRDFSGPYQQYAICNATDDLLANFPPCKEFFSKNGILGQHKADVPVKFDWQASCFFHLGIISND